MVFCFLLFNNLWFYKYFFLFIILILHINNFDYIFIFVYHHYSVPTILQVVTRICFRKKLFYYRF